MAKKVQRNGSQRRSPTQLRVRATIDAIFEATARIIEREGIAALNTNRIAERAGLSIGTLYDDFPTIAILIAMARRRLDKTRPWSDKRSRDPGQTKMRRWCEGRSERW